MGSGSYSTNDSGFYDASVRSIRLNKAGIDYDSMDRGDIFKQRSLNNAMDPKNAVLRESRDSIEHPESVAIIIALDVTGSMGSIPHFLIKKGLPTLMGNIIQRGIKDPQILFLAIGDHECDRAPLQVGQFESSDELLDKWLTTVYLEGGGGGNDGESYLLSWYFASKHTSIDCFEKRNQKGFLFTIGDEPTLKSIPEKSIQDIMGIGQFDKQNDATYLLDNARKTYNVYHLHLKEGHNGRSQQVMDGWKQLMGDDLLVIDKKEDISKIISERIIHDLNKKVEEVNFKKEDTKIIL